jgi:hypothetical protein
MSELSLWPTRTEENESKILDDEDYLRYLTLKSGKIISTDFIPGTEGRRGANKPLLVTLQSSSSIRGVSEKVAAVAKPVHHENTSTRGEISYSRYEIASAWVAKALGISSYPMSCLRKLEINGYFGEVFLQEYVDGAILQDVEGKSLREMEEMLVFDFLIWNKDRHYANALAVNNLVVPIDHGKSFAKDIINEDNFQTLKVLVANLNDEMLTGNIHETMRTAIFRLANPNDQLRRALDSKLSNLLPKKEALAFWKRLDLIKNQLTETGNIRNLIEHLITRGIDREKLYYGEISLGKDTLGTIRIFANSAIKRQLLGR